MEISKHNLYSPNVFLPTSKIDVCTKNRSVPQRIVRNLKMQKSSWFCSPNLLLSSRISEVTKKFSALLLQLRWFLNSCSWPKARNRTGSLEILFHELVSRFLYLQLAMLRCLKFCVVFQSPILVVLEDHTTVYVTIFFIFTSFKYSNGRYENLAHSPVVVFTGRLRFYNRSAFNIISIRGSSKNTK